MPIKKMAFWSLAAAVAAASFSNSFFEIFSGVFLGFSLLLVLSEKKFDIYKSPFGIAAAVYLTVVLLTLTQSAYAGESLRGAFRVLRCVLMAFFAVYLIDDEKKFGIVFRVFAVTAFLVGLDAMVQGATSFEVLRGRAMTRFTEEVGRITGPFRHANDFSAYLTLAIFLFLGMTPYVFQKKKGKEIAWVLAGSAVLVACLVWTYSRGAWVAVALAFVFLAFLKRNKAMLLAVVVAAITIFLVSPASLQQRMRSFGDLRDGTVKERRILWDEALRMTAERPWLGHGINTYATVEPRFKSKEVYTDNQYAHNGYLQIAAETGWVGLGAFFAVIAAFFATVLRAGFYRRPGFLAAGAFSITVGILSFLMHSATDTNLQSLRLVSLFWLSMGMVLAAVRIQEKEPR